MKLDPFSSERVLVPQYLVFFRESVTRITFSHTLSKKELKKLHSLRSSSALNPFHHPIFRFNGIFREILPRTHLHKFLFPMRSISSTITQQMIGNNSHYLFNTCRHWYLRSNEITNHWHRQMYFFFR